MNHSGPRQRLLSALLMLSQSNEIIDIFSLAEEAGLDLFVTLKTLNELARSGLADVRSLRLTLAGLAVAASLCSEARHNAERAFEEVSALQVA